MAQEKSKVSILIADDHPIVRVGLRTLLERENDFVIVGESDDGRRTVELARDLKPDILILDLMMPGLNGVEAAKLIKICSPSTRVIILSMHATEVYVLESLRNGARGYVLKDSTGSDLVHAIREVLEGRQFLSPPLSAQEVEKYAEATKNSNFDRYETLTIREKEVLYMAAEGFSNMEIADKLAISTRTVEVHRANLMHKIGLKRHNELVWFALRKGILPLHEL